MFAFRALDEQERTLFLVRDRVGIKPLYYVHLEKKSGQDVRAPLVFASEVKSILASGLIKAEMDQESVASVPDVSVGA